MSTNLEYRERERRRKEKVGDRPAKLNVKKGNRELKSEAIKKTKKKFFCWIKQHENFVAAVRKLEMLPATKVKKSGSSKKKVSKSTYDISSIKRVTWKFLEVSRCSRAINGKNVCCTCKVAFLLIRPIVTVDSVFRAL